MIQRDRDREEVVTMKKSEEKPIKYRIKYRKLGMDTGMGIMIQCQ